MGMVEERKAAAAAVISHSEYMYGETGNPFYVANALYAAHWGDFTAPEWALKALLSAVYSTMRTHHESGTRISIDSALGLTIGRGKGIPEARAKKQSSETTAFRLVKTIHACFDVSIPSACEIAYYAVDCDFAQAMERQLWRPSRWLPDMERFLTFDEWLEVDSRSKKDSQQIIENSGHPEAIKHKLRSGEWWNVTHGDRVGYSLDNFIEQYHRAGTKLKVKGSGRLTGEELIFFDGSDLLLSPERCTRAIEMTKDPDYPLRCISELHTLPMRPAFAKFNQHLDEITGSKSGV